MKRFLENKKFDSIFLFFEKKFICWVITVLCIVVIVLKTLTLFSLGKLDNYTDAIDIIISSKLPEWFINRDSTLITLSAIFIGIYFTTFTLMATISSKSSFSLLKTQQFKDLIIYIRNAFGASFLYLVVSLVLPVFSKTEWFFSVVSLLLLVYMLLSAFRFGALIYMILEKDVNRYLQDLESEKVMKVEQDNIYKELKMFLDREKQKEKVEQAEKMSAMLQERKNNKKS
ncbi:hypothetical protein [Metasolibacillus sp.]|uniref:hypothetical protein n=1 Tax=Metasolibacillus sp. TaxID=2703680 RepID=UPI0025D8B2D8|nr:hypothetical protein [Metasolibacillus sp.]MCT6924505.1 hypothetical protein [Metasolibacillus sp.]MCT6940781.1 hypothetical protein [Metasolibacillus sp.]